MKSRESIMALALLSFLRVHHDNGRLSVSVNAMRKETGLHPDTIKKRMAALERKGFIAVAKGTVYLRSVSSQHPDRNITINIAMTDTVKEIAVKLVAYYHNIINQRKNFASRIIRHEKTFTPEDVKNDYRMSKRYGWTGKEFHDYGVSYDYMAKAFGMARGTAVSMIRKAVAMGVLIKRNMSYCFYAGHIASFLDMAQVRTLGTFISRKGYIHKVFGNQYHITDKLCTDICYPVDF